METKRKKRNKSKCFGIFIWLFPTTLSFNIPASRDKVSFILIYRWRCLPSVMLTVKSDFETRETSFETQALSLVMWSEQTVYHPWVSGSLTMKWERQLCHSQKAERMKSDAGCESLNLKSNLSFPDARGPSLPPSSEGLGFDTMTELSSPGTGWSPVPGLSVMHLHLSQDTEQR